MVNLTREQDEDHHPRQLQGGEDHHGPGAAQGDWAWSRLLHRKCKHLYIDFIITCYFLIIIAQRTDGFGGRGKKTGSDIIPLGGSFLGGALLRFLTSSYSFIVFGRVMDEHGETMASCRPGEFKQKVN